MQERIAAETTEAEHPTEYEDDPVLYTRPDYKHSPTEI
jgi:hypothetical protein